MSTPERFVPRFAAEPPQEGLPYGRWADRLCEEFLAACAQASDADEEIGRPGEIAWCPDRTWGGLTYVPASALSDRGYELFGYVSFLPAGQDGGEPQRLQALADYTEETAERNPDWKLDICDEVIGHWRGHGGQRASMTLVWGRALVPGGRIAVAELGGVRVDECELEQERFTLIAPDDYGSDLLEVVLLDGRGRELARESLYAQDDEDEPSQEVSAEPGSAETEQA
jgi:hypothetical protein